MEYTGPISVLSRSKKAMARVYMWKNKTGSYRKLVNNGSCNVDAAMRAVVAELDNDSSLKKTKERHKRLFLVPAWLKCWWGNLTGPAFNVTDRRFVQCLVKGPPLYKHFQCALFQNDTWNESHSFIKQRLKSWWQKNVKIKKMQKTNILGIGHMCLLQVKTSPLVDLKVFSLI